MTAPYTDGTYRPGYAVPEPLPLPQCPDITSEPSPYGGQVYRIAATGRLLQVAVHFRDQKGKHVLFETLNPPFDFRRWVTFLEVLR